MNYATTLDTPAINERKLASIGPRILKPPGSIDHGWATVDYLKDILKNSKQRKELEKKAWQAAYDELKQYKYWEILPPEKPYGSLESLLDSEFGLGLDVAEDEGLLEEYVVLGPHRRPTKEEETNKPYYSKVYFGNSQSYILARLRRDRPDILADYEAGKYRSARQAGIAAGFVKDRRYIQVLPEPHRIAQRLKEVLTPEQIEELKSLL